jgi:23S rRNA (uracil747-C5)-methyltransferase
MLESLPMKCQNFLQKHCLSCDLLSHEYLSSMAIKEQKLSSLFPEHIDKIKSPVVCQQGTEGTRNKAKLAVALIQGEIEFGFYDNKMQFKKLEDCPLHALAINEILVVLKNQLNTHKIVPYDLFSKKGELKYVLITYSESANELLIRFILRSKESLHRLKKLTADLMALHPVIKVVTANIQNKHQAILEGDEEIVLTENDCIAHHFDQYSLFQGPRSFFQTNSAMALELYRQFQKELSVLSVDSFLDLYCGVGAFSFFAEKHCSKVVGVEISDAAILYANKAREVNESIGIHFSAMDVEVFLKNQQSTCFDAVMVNPPRRGLNESIIASLMRLAPAYLFYSSCNAETLRRDIASLDAQYQVQSLQIFDMFPFTGHYETLAVLSRKM